MNHSLGWAPHCPMRCHVSPPRIQFCDHFKPSFQIKDEQQADSFIWCRCSFGDANLGKFLVNETFEVKQSLPLQEATLRCPSRRLLRVGYPLLHPLLHLPHRDQGLAGLVGGSLHTVVDNSYTAMTKTPGALFRSSQTTKGQINGCDRPG